MRSHPLRKPLLIGAAYDAAAGLAIMLALRPLSTIVPIPYPAEPIYAQLCGVLLLGLAGFYTSTAITLPNSIPSVVAAIAIRSVGGAFLVAAPWLDPATPWFFAVFGAVDLAFAAWIALAWRKP